MIGSTISHYKIIEHIGSGGMGVVYRAEDTKLKRSVALKFLPTAFATDPTLKERFIHEARSASALQHSNICTIHEIDETVDGQMYIVMDYYEGETLKSKIEKGKLQIEEAINYAIQIAQGLQKAHEKGIIHRDIKPANIIVTNDGEAKILDFGLSKFKGQTKITKTGSTSGTVSYMSPEQTRGEEVDYRTDIWSFGVMLYEMVTGELPFGGDYDQAIIYCIMNEEPKSLTELRDEAQPELQQIVQTTLAKNMEKRYKDVGDLIEDLHLLKKKSSSGIQSEKFHIQRSGAAQWYVYGAIIILLFFVVWIFFSNLDSGSVNRKSIAVLPFDNLSNEKENEYFSDGITEDIITQLSKIADLRVVSRTSILQYKNSNKKLEEIGEELNVANILEGSVRRVNNQVRIVSQLIDVKTDEHLWAETYDRELKDIFAIQSEIAKHIASALEATLTPDEKNRIEKKPTNSLSAYDFYLKGRDYYYRYKKKENSNAVELFQKALNLDKDYALAWAGLADAYAQMPVRFGFESFWLDSALVAGERAVELDANLAEAQKALGTVYLYKGWYDKALESYRKAVELKPNYFSAVSNIGVIYYFRGSLDESLRWFKKTVSLHPTFALAYTNVGEIYRLLIDHRKSEQWLNKALAIQPDQSHAYYLLALVNLADRNDQEAMKYLDQMLAVNPDDSRLLEQAGQIARMSGNHSKAQEYYQKSILNNPSIETDWFTTSGIGVGYSFLKAGNTSEANKLLNLSLDLRLRHIEEGDANFETRYFLAAIYAIRNDKEESYKWLQKAIDAGWRESKLALRDPWLENLHQDVQFKQMISQVEYKIDQMRQNADGKGW
jgi:eukaryotic-like serine/threonine-protein kinase